MSAAEGTKATPSKTRKPWLTVMSGLCAILLLDGAVKANPTADIAYPIGASLIPALTLAALTWVVSRQIASEASHDALER